MSKPPAPLQPPLTKQQVAARFGGVSIRFVDELLARRILPKIKLGRKLVRIPSQAVEDYLASHTREAAVRK
jgi:excisionase family DNA binding protein